MKIAFFLPDLRPGGAERVNLDLAREFSLAGHDIQFVLAQAEGELLGEAKALGSVVDLNCHRIRTTVGALSRYLKASQPDALVVAMWPLTVIAPISVWISGHRCRVLVSEHAVLSLQYRKKSLVHKIFMRISMMIGYRLADARVGVSSGVVKDIASMSIMDPSKFFVIYNPISKPLMPDAEDIDHAMDVWGNAEVKILTVGNLKEEKNHKLLIRAFCRLGIDDSRLIILGKGMLKDQLQSLASDLGVGDKVILGGFVSDPTPFYMTADLFVLTSDHEGFGNVLVESLACGTPIVSTDCPYGPSEILEGGKYGSLVPRGDVEALACAMAGALDDSHDIGALKERAQDFSPERSAHKYIDLLRKQ